MKNVKSIFSFIPHVLLLIALVASAGVLVISGPLRAEDAPPPTPDDAKGFVYKTVNGAEVKLDVFAPPGGDAAKARPVLIYFHGGGFTSGDKGYTTQMCRYFAKRGLVVVTCNYRFLTKDASGVEGTRIICLLDAKSAIRWVRGHAKELGIDPDRVILGGSSAGAYLVMMAALNADFNDPADDVKIPTTASALVLLSSPFSKPYPADATAKIDKAGPNAWLKAPLPPMIAISGEKDHLRENSFAFLLACRALGAKVELWTGPGQEHAFNPPGLWMDAMCVKVDAFLGGLGFVEGPAPAAPAGTSFVPQWR